MYDALYSILVLVDTGILSYTGSRIFLNLLWENFGMIFLNLNERNEEVAEFWRLCKQLVLITFRKDK